MWLCTHICVTTTSVIHVWTRFWLWFHLHKSGRTPWLNPHSLLLFFCTHQTRNIYFCTNKREFSCEIGLMGTHGYCKCMQGNMHRQTDEIRETFTTRWRHISQRLGKQEHAGIVWEGESHLTKISLFLSLCNFYFSLFWFWSNLSLRERRGKTDGHAEGETAGETHTHRDIPTFGTTLWFSEVNLILFALCKKTASASTSVDFHWRQKHR